MLPNDFEGKDEYKVFEGLEIFIRKLIIENF